MSWEPIYRLVKRIPRGRLITYGAIARILKVRGGARAVGFAMAASPSGRGIPWHRVVGAGGRLLIPEPHASLQRRLLETEGVTVIEARRVDLARYLWQPKSVPKRRVARKPSRRRAVRKPRAHV
jgi:methylated-DNA-protein-cysteine methyltransferase related protein